MLNSGIFFGGLVGSVKIKLIKILLICESLLLLLCLFGGSVIHMQKIKNKSGLFLDATRNDFLIDDKRSIFHAAEVARISHDFLNIEFKTKDEHSDKELSFLDFSYELPIRSDIEKQDSELLGKAIFIYSIVPGLLNGLLAWIVISVTILILIPFLKSYFEEFLRKELEVENLKELNQIASQVSHDIRSPLSALSMVVGTLKEIPEEKRVLIRNATQRINDIANDLLRKGQKLHLNQEDAAGSGEPLSQRSSESLMLSTEFIPAIIDILVSEKRMQYREHTGLEIDVDLKNSFGAFARINSNELKRVISNLINNSVEALYKHEGRVIVGVRKTSVAEALQVELFVKDNGKGIPKHILEKLGEAGVSHGKDGTQSGSGLGIHHAKKTAESFGGSLQIESTVGQGALIRMILPLADAPTWFADKIDLTGKKYLVSLDDDISIHQIWSGRLQNFGFSDIEHVKFQSGEAFFKYVNSNINKLKQTTFLVDFELLNQPRTGLDIIYDLGIEKYSILVTSRYEETEIQFRAEKLKLPILPKSLAGFVPFERSTPKEFFDWVLLDDDDLVRMSWSYAAKETNSRFIGFKSNNDFEAYKSKIDPSSNIYIDSSLGEEIRGEEIAKKLFGEGFQNLYLATGYGAEQFQPMDFIRAIVGKEPPIVVKNN